MCPKRIKTDSKSSFFWVLHIHSHSDLPSAFVSPIAIDHRADTRVVNRAMPLSKSEAHSCDPWPTLVPFYQSARELLDSTLVPVLLHLRFRRLYVQTHRPLTPIRTVVNTLRLAPFYDIAIVWGYILIYCLEVKLHVQIPNHRTL
jgi:hypothetical protein